MENYVKTLAYCDGTDWSLVADIYTQIYIYIHIYISQFKNGELR